MEKAEQYRRRLNFSNLMCNSAGSTWLFYQDSFAVVVVGECSQHISVEFSHFQLLVFVTLSFVHARCTASKGEGLWKGLLHDNPGMGAWLVGGNFDVVTKAHEKRGG